MTTLLFIGGRMLFLGAFGGYETDIYTLSEMLCRCLIGSMMLYTAYRIDTHKNRK